jgi:glycosyltransferase involved in cell wall biosynthesis
MTISMSGNAFEFLRVVLVANTDWYLANFRFGLACALRDRGAEVHCIAPPGKYLEWLQDQGFSVHALEMGEQSYSPTGNWRTLRHLKQLYGELKPDLAHHFTPRCVVLGSMAARSAGVPAVVNALTGLGHVFTSQGWKARLVRPVFRSILQRVLADGKNANGIRFFGRGQGPSYRGEVVFQNDEDLQELARANVVDKSNCHLIRGSGVDTEKFRPSEGERDDDEIRVLFASRVIGEKGIRELAVAMGEVVHQYPKEVVHQYPNARLWVAGEPYAQNPTSLTTKELERLGKVPWVKLFGHVDDVVSLLHQSDIVALPSYREGTPKILLEAASCGLPIVATDIAGCRGVVEEGVNGYLVPVKDSTELAGALLKLFESDETRREIGMKGRAIIEQGFSSEVVISRTMEVYDKVLL